MEIEHCSWSYEIERSYKATTVNLPYKDVINKLQAGPSTRGQKRKKYKINSGDEPDVYGIVLEAIQDIMTNSAAIYQVFEWKDIKLILLNHYFCFILDGE